MAGLLIPHFHSLHLYAHHRIPISSNHLISALANASSRMRTTLPYLMVSLGAVSSWGQSEPAFIPRRAAHLRCGGLGAENRPAAAERDPRALAGQSGAFAAMREGRLCAHARQVSGSGPVCCCQSEPCWHDGSPAFRVPFPLCPSVLRWQNRRPLAQDVGASVAGRPGHPHRFGGSILGSAVTLGEIPRGFDFLARPLPLFGLGLLSAQYCPANLLEC